MKTKQVKLPEGKLCSNCCGDCIWMELSERDNNGQSWCSKHRVYYSPSSYAGNCSSFRQK